MTPVSLLLLSIASAGAPADSVLLDFHAKWCGPCQQVSKVVSRLQRQGHNIRKVDVDQEREVAQQFDIRFLPTFVLIVNGKEVDRAVGGDATEGRLKQMLARIPQTEMETVSTPSRSAPARNAAPAVTNPQPVQLAQHESEGKSLFQIPFFGRKNREKQAAPVVLNDNATVRGNAYDEQPIPANPSADPALAYSTRIRVRDDRGINFGSGTILESQTGRTVILTCGHIFRDLPKNASIEVDVFLGKRFETFLGEIIEFDLDGDVGLIAIRTADALPVARLASEKSLISTSDRVYSIGCGGGEAPSRQSLVVTALNRYEGPHNIECTGVPQQGRSGGGLFGQNGEVIGVCIAADPKERRGLYAGYEAVHALLEQAGMAHLYRDVSQSPREEFALAAEEGRDRAIEELAEAAAPNGALTRTNQEVQAADAGAAPERRPQAAALANLEGMGDSEVICIIRPRGQAQGTSRVIVINQASTKFMSYLTNEVNQQPHPTTASVRFDKPVAAEGARRARPVEVAPTSQPPERIQRYRRSAESR